MKNIGKLYYWPKNYDSKSINKNYNYGPFIYFQLYENIFQIKVDQIVVFRYFSSSKNIELEFHALEYSKKYELL